MPKTFHSKIELISQESVLNSFDCHFELSVSANEIIALVNAPDSGVDDLARAITADRSLTLRVMKIANSPYYGFSRKINTVKDAIVLLGHKSLLNMVLAFAIKGLHHNMGAIEKGLWEESVALALATQFLALNIKDSGMGVDEAFMAGLLCNIGELIVNRCDPMHYKKVLEESGESGQREELSQKLCANSFSNIGASTLQHWNLSPLLVLGAYYVGENDLCGDRSDELYRACSVISLARRMVHSLSIGNYSTPNPSLYGGSAALLFDLRQEKIDELRGKFKALFAEKGSHLVDS